MAEVRHHPVLDDLLASQPEDAVWENELRAALEGRFSHTSGVRVRSLRCASQFCRLELLAPDAQTDMLEMVVGLREVSKVDGPLMLEVNADTSGSAGVFYFPKEGESLPLPPPKGA